MGFGEGLRRRAIMAKMDIDAVAAAMGGGDVRNGAIGRADFIAPRA